MRHWLMICLSLLLISCGEQIRPPNPRTTFEIYRTVEQSSEARPIDANGVTLYIEQPPVITQDDIASADLTLDQMNRPALALAFTAQGTASMEHISKTETGKPLVILVDGTFWTAPIINGPLSDGIILAGPDFSETKLRRIAAGLNR